MATKQLTLREAIQSGKLPAFIKQEEVRGVAPVDEGELMESIERTIKPRQSEDQTSRSASRDGSAEK